MIKTLNRKSVALVLSVSLLLTDRVLKYLALQGFSFFIIEPFVSFEFAKNNGIAFSIPLPFFLTIPLSLALVGYLMAVGHGFRKSPVGIQVAWGALVFGGVSNIIDRIWYGYVIDYLAIHDTGREMLIVNLADVAVVFGVIYICGNMIFGHSLEQEERRKKEAEELLAQNERAYAIVAEEFIHSREKPLWDEIINFKKYVGTGFKILDIGCGSGRLMQMFKDGEISYTGIDTTPAFVAHAKKLGEWFRERNPNFHARIVVGDMRYLPFTDAMFDVVFMVASLHHMPSVYHKRALQEAYRVVKKGGVLCMTNFNLWRWSLTGKTVWRYNFPFALQSLKDVITRWHNNPLYYYAFTLQELKRICRETGFHIVEARYANKGNRARVWNGYNLVVVAKK